MPKRLAVAALVALSAAAGSAGAAPGAQVIDVAGAPETSASLRSAASEALGGDLVARPHERARERLAAGAVPRQRLADFARSWALLAEGWRAYVAVRAEFAASRLAEARRLAIQVADLPGGPELVAEVSLRLGAVKLDLGRRAEAEDDFRLAQRLAPQREVTDAEFKPEVVAVARSARDGSRGTGVLVVRGSSAGAEVAVDRGAFAAAPRALTLEAGLHLLVARAAGHRSVADVVLVVPEQRGDVVLDPIADPQRAALRSPPRPGDPEVNAAAAVRALIAYGDLDGLLLVASVWRQGAPAVLAQWCEHPARCSPVIEIRYREGDIRAALAEAARRARSVDLAMPPLLTVDARVTDPESRGPDTRGTGDSSPWSNPWLWVGVGAAATTVAVSLALVLSGDDDDEFPVVVGDICDLGSC